MASPVRLMVAIKRGTVNHGTGPMLGIGRESDRLVALVLELHVISRCFAGTVLIWLWRDLRRTRLVLRLVRSATAITWKNTPELRAVGTDEARKDDKVSDKYACGQLTDSGSSQRLWIKGGFWVGGNARAYAYSCQVKSRVVTFLIDGAEVDTYYTCREGPCIVFSINIYFLPRL